MKRQYKAIAAPPNDDRNGLHTYEGAGSREDTVNYWMLSMPEEHFNVTRDQGYKVQGFGIRQRRKTDRMVKGDKLLYYVKGLRVFPVAATIISTVFEDETPLWLSTQANELYKYRVRTRAELILRPDQYLQANQIAPRMEYVRRWPPEMWPHAFWEELHLLPRKDFELIEEEMRKVLRGQGPIPAPSPSVIATAAVQVSEPLGLGLQDSEGATA